MKFEPSQRVKILPQYVFVELARRKRELLAAGKDVIELGIGDPERPTYGFIIDRLKATVDKPENHRYTLLMGVPKYREQIAEFMRQRYDVQLEPHAEIMTLIGSKEGIGHLPLAVVNPGNGVLVPNPGYPAYRSDVIFADGIPHNLPLHPELGWLPDLNAVPADVAQNTKLMFFNYPNNPTGACAPAEFFDRALAFAKKHDIILAHDAAYNEMYFGDEKPPSILQFPGAKDYAVEFHSASKTFNMTGWRIGFVAGNKDVLAALGKIKANYDSGQFAPIQEAAIAAYAGYDRPELHEARALYQERAKVMTAGLRAAGFTVQEPKATFYIWAGVPKGYDSMSALNRLLDEAHVVGVPGTGFGTQGEGYIRFATTVDLERTREATVRIKNLKW